MEEADEKPRERAAIQPNIALAPLALSLRRSGPAGEQSAAADDRFRAALTELKDLKTQLHHAADYFEGAFRRSSPEYKNIILKNAKSYICDAIVAVVDHLGTVSSKIEEQICQITETKETVQRIDFMKQRLLMHDQFVVTLELSVLRWTPPLKKLHQNYLMPSTSHPAVKQNCSFSEEELLNQKDQIFVAHELEFSEPRILQKSGKQRTMPQYDSDSPTMIINSFDLKVENKIHDHKKPVRRGKNLRSFFGISKRKA